MNTFSYKDGDQTVTGTFTDWIVEQSKLKQRVWRGDHFEWQSENVSDGTEVNINQIDISISRGEKVEIKVRSISEAGYPNNPLRSEWSNSIIVEFPDNLQTTNAMADLVKEVNDDATNIAIMNVMESIGVNSHLDDSIANTNSINGLYFKHTADNIAYEDLNQTMNTVTSVSVQDKIDELVQQIQNLKEENSILLTRLTALENEK